MMKRESWIDALKGIAIMAVVLDHAWYLLPAGRINLIWQHTFFSIPWFVFLSGIANTLSAQKKEWRFPKSYLAFWRRRLLGIFVPFILATIAVHYAFHFPKIDLGLLWHELLYFSAQPTFYFINLILQLYLLFPFLYSLLRGFRKGWMQVILTGIVFICSFFIFTIGPPPWPFSPPGALFAGQLLFIFYLGMLFAKYKPPMGKFATIFVLLILVGYEIAIGRIGGGFLRTINYNSLIWSMSLLIITKKLIDVLARIKIPLGFLAFLGRHVLFIYLFHFLFMILFIRLIIFFIPTGGFLIMMVTAVVLSLLTEEVFGFIQRKSLMIKRW